MRTYNEKISIYNGMASIMAMNVANTFFPIFAITILGATNYQVGLISSLPPLIALLMTIPAAIWLNKAHTHKELVGYSIIAARSLFFLIIFIVYLPSEWQAWVFLAVIALMNVPTTIATIGWQTLISGLIDESRRGQFFSDRNRLLTIIGMVSTVVVGVVLRDATKSVLSYQVLFFIALCFGLLEGYFIFRHKEETLSTEGIVAQRKLMDWSIFQDIGYRWFLVAALFFNFAWQMAWGIFNIYHVRYAEATIFWISMFAAGNMSMQIVTFPLWKKWADKHSNVLVFVVVAIGMATTPFLTVLTTNLFALLIVQTISGFFLSGVVLILFNMLLEHSPSDKRTYCITTYNVLLSAMAFIAPQVGILLLELLGVELAMHINALLRLLSGVLFFVMYVSYSRKKKIVTEISRRFNL
ncbi:MFS transporter [Paenisporosarcina cavernae]|uniref:MFS transporter n=1 Tax=Paenisporosarcina cavernae TaxID=2320858 RepID=A0A385YUF2_9BACL|nr:MFS transporter [Paenisporosarcina cavernae]AYC30489.1 MFS transporter [Paenisporosarcina cavernae]